MDDSEKPFACSSPGCNMSFTNEDHLVVHKKKHDMVLNLGNNGKATFVADQTPTPTRFIRNCEEVGLFQDLQNVNPFEETFRRAVEDGKAGALSESEAGVTDDTLHTPHIFPNMKGSTIVALEEAESEKSKEHSIKKDANPEVCVRSETIVQSEKMTETCSAGIVVQEAHTAMTTKIIATPRSTSSLSINGQEVQLLLKTADGKLVQLSAVPVSNNKIDNYRTIERETRNVVAKAAQSGADGKKNCTSPNDRLSLAKMRLKQTLTKNGITSSPIPINDCLENAESSKYNDKSTGNSDQRKKEDVLARNRASSMRARAKRKAWIQQLQRTACNANEKNAALQLEVKALRSEVAKLRTLLLAHENCSVTKSLGKGSQVGLESKNSSIVQTVVQNIQTSRINVLPRRKILTKSGETPIAPKMTKLSHPIILPKTETIKQDYVVKDMSTLKIVDVRSVPSENESTKKLLLIENPTRRLEFVRTPSRQCIQLNPTIMQIENAASKCTGT